MVFLSWQHHGHGRRLTDTGFNSIYSYFASSISYHLWQSWHRSPIWGWWVNYQVLIHHLVLVVVRKIRTIPDPPPLIEPKPLPDFQPHTLSCGIKILIFCLVSVVLTIVLEAFFYLWYYFHYFFLPQQSHIIMSRCTGKIRCQECCGTLASLCCCCWEWLFFQDWTWPVRLDHWKPWLKTLAAVWPDCHLIDLLLNSIVQVKCC